jgi:DNA-directed RNA polymerase specialized sigma24 family protein
MREALMLVAVEGTSYEEAATVLDCHLGTVKSRVSRGRDQLGRMLGLSAAEIGADSVLLSAVSIQEQGG